MSTLKGDPWEQEKLPQGAFGVHDHDWEQLQQEVNEIETLPADPETNIRFIDTISRLNAKSPYIKILVFATVFLTIAAFIISYTVYIKEPVFIRLSIEFISSIFTTELIKYIGVGIAAQLVDGALGMAYGVTCSSFLLGLGVPPSVTSASVHVAEIFTTGASGLSHLKFGNVNKKLFRYLLFPGIIGAITGAWLLSDIINGDYIKPFIAVYLIFLGTIILIKASKKDTVKKKTKNLGWLAGFGGFMDSIGGGGWGPIVTSTLLSKGRAANYTIGSVNLAEFFIALAGAGTFLIFTGLGGWQAITGLVIGGVIASPFAAIVVSAVKRKTLMIIVGALVIVLSIRTFILADYQALYLAIRSFLG